MPLAERAYGAFFAACVACALTACGTTVSPSRDRSSQPADISPPRQLGAWNGKGNTTLGFVSESGSFRVSWRAQNEISGRPGNFHLTLRSGISGRPLTVIADHHGEGTGTVDFGDDPRMYEFLVEANGAAWSIRVEETFNIRGQTP